MVGGGAEGADTSTPPPAVAVELSVEPSLEHEDNVVRTTTEPAGGATLSSSCSSVRSDRQISQTF